VAEKRFSNLVGFDDAPFDRDHKGKVKLVGTVYAGLRFDGVLIGEVEKDGFDAADRLATLIGGSRFAEHIQLIMLQGIAFAGFNVVDVFALHERLGLPVLVVSRKQPDMAAIQEALLSHIEAGKAKWAVCLFSGWASPLIRRPLFWISLWFAAIFPSRCGPLILSPAPWFTGIAGAARNRAQLWDSTKRKDRP